MVDEAKVLAVLEDLLKEEDVLACMVARKGLQGIIPNNDKFKIKDVGVWKILQETMDPFFEIIARYYSYDLDKVDFELGENVVIFFTLKSDVALVCITPALANRGLLEVEIENARRSILKIVEEEK